MGEKNWDRNSQTSNSGFEPSDLPEWHKSAHKKQQDALNGLLTETNDPYSEEEISNMLTRLTIGGRKAFLTMLKIVKP